MTASEYDAFTTDVLTGNSLETTYANARLVHRTRTRSRIVLASQPATPSRTSGAPTSTALGV
ncbi:hypothetical protein, partial [Streptomyces roseolilacinus]|uniref:hypothetical protein n=1 Tax=Streptomyces roseolilacinus TaxID=66904 RepID=UPI0038020CEA